MDIGGELGMWDGSLHNENMFTLSAKLVRPDDQLPEPLPPNPKKKKNYTDFVKHNKIRLRDREEKINKSEAIVTRNKLELNLSGWVPDTDRIREPVLPKKLQKPKLQPVPPKYPPPAILIRPRLHAPQSGCPPQRKQRSSVCNLILRIEEERERIEHQSAQLTDMLVKERQRERIIRQQATDWNRNHRTDGVGDFRKPGQFLPLLPPRVM
eukprot:TRINITY_DN36696_c0_g1_i1.p1 TRINITY_DN36696_c0_g1~~TRINITY_DN36696_c0_g1_i1.p1  ORF type:complete len:210 (+),score=24.27 TRINITY_DN36696_c0_g1_i1:97-726(+)